MTHSFMVVPDCPFLPSRQRSSLKIGYHHDLYSSKTKISFAAAYQLILIAPLPEECLLALPDSTEEANPESGILLQDLK